MIPLTEREIYFVKRECPHCGELIYGRAQLCHHCKREDVYDERFWVDAQGRAIE